MKNIFKTEYRIVRDNFLGYECQHKRWWWPFWTQMGFTNTHRTIEEARTYIDKWKIVETQSAIVEYYQPLSKY